MSFNHFKRGLKRIVRLVAVLTLFSTFLSIAYGSQPVILKGNSREAIPLKPGMSAIETIKNYKKSKRLAEQRRLNATEATPMKKPRFIFQEAESKLLNGEYDTLRWDEGSDWGFVNFGFDTGDSMAQWFVPLAGCTVKAIVLYVVDFEGKVEPFIHASHYRGEVTSHDCADSDGWIGLYEGGVWKPGDNECFSDPPLGEELWPGLGDADPYIVPITPDDGQSYISIDLSEGGYPDVGSDPFFIDMAIERTDGWGFGARDVRELPYHGFKYYAGDGTSGNPGWHIRSFGWEMFAVVHYYEDIPPFISDVTFSPWREPEEVCATIMDENPGGGPSGVSTAWFYWENGGVVDSVEMIEQDDDKYCAQLPDRFPSLCEGIKAWVLAVDVNGNSSYYHLPYLVIFCHREQNLFINNTHTNNWISEYYLNGVSVFGEFSYDIWSYGPVTIELLENYETVIDVSGGGPNFCYDFDDLASWLDSGNKNFLVTGDEWLGECFYGWWNPVDITQGDFVYDYLGIDYYYPDINYMEGGDQFGISRMVPVEGDAISGAAAAYLADSLLLNYDPDYEISALNWLDGVDAVEGFSVAYWGLSGILDSLLNPASDADTFAVSVYTEHPNGSKTAFFGFDPLSLNTMAMGADTLHGAGYHWIGVYPQGPIPQALLWMDAYADVTNDITQTPQHFVLHQNYPNPFNTVTTIRYDLPEASDVRLVIYDLLGREVARLVDSYQDAGYHMVSWNGKDRFGREVATGVYIYTLHTGNFISTKKLLLLK